MATINNEANNICTRYTNSGFIPMEVKTKDGKAHRLTQNETFNTTKQNYITHTRRLLTGREKFKKLTNAPIRTYEFFN